MYRRVLIKISGEALSGNLLNCNNDVLLADIEKAEKQGKDTAKLIPPVIYNRQFIDSFIDEIKTITADGFLGKDKKPVQVAVVTGAGNYWRGRSSDYRINRTSSDNMGMLATAMNALYLADCFNQAGICARISSSVQIGHVLEGFNRQNVLEYMNNGQVIVFAYGTGHPYLSTDSAAAIYGSQLDCDAILALKYGVEGVYTDDPNGENKENAKFIEKISYSEILANKKIRVIDNEAAGICRTSKVPTIIFGYGKVEERGNIIKAVRGEKIGTYCGAYEGEMIIRSK